MDNTSMEEDRRCLQRSSGPVLDRPEVLLSVLLSLNTSMPGFEDG